jgi:hypothetical protein
MSKIQERLNELRPYVVGIRYLQGIQLVDAILKEGWAVPESQVINRERVDGDENYYMFFSDNEDIDIDDLLDFVQEIISLNIEREKKYELLKLKIGELQKMFKENTLTKLQKLKFTFNEPDIIPSLMDMDNIQPDIEIVEELKVVELKIDEPKVQVNPQPIKSNKNVKTHTISKTNDIELPPKPGEKIELVEFNEPKVVCKCGPNEMCPICEEEN